MAMLERLRQCVAQVEVPEGCRTVGEHVQVQIQTVFHHGQVQEASVFEVRLERQPDSVLGMKVQPRHNGLRVLEVKQIGLVADWNSVHPGLDLREGDRIIDVNKVSVRRRSEGMEVTVKDLMKEMAQSTVHFVFLVQRKKVEEEQEQNNPSP